jgi:membrane-associated phospholipid phosphatase
VGCLGGLGGLGGLGLVGGLASLNLANSGPVAEALISTRDGIVGPWAPPGPNPVQLPLENPNNLERWEPWVRASVFDFELVSHLGFRRARGNMILQHLRPGIPAYRPLAEISRPRLARFKQYLGFMNSYADLRGDRATEIMTQMNGTLAFLSAIPFLNPSRTPYTFELLGAALRLANFAEMRFKQALASRRPNEFSPQVQPIVLTPSHSTYPSGHATEAFTSAYVLWQLLRASGRPQYAHRSWLTQLMRLASRIAINRTIAGVHFPVDSAAGCFLGIQLGRYLWRLGSGGANYPAFRFIGTAYPWGNPPPNDGDFYWEVIFRRLHPPPGPAVPYIANAGVQPLARSPMLRWLWRKARQEWR